LRLFSFGGYRLALAALALVVLALSNAPRIKLSIAKFPSFACQVVNQNVRVFFESRAKRCSPTRVGLIGCLAVASTNNVSFLGPRVSLLVRALAA